LLEFFILVAFNKKWSTKKIIVVIFQAVLGLFAIIMFSSKIINKLFIERGDTQEDRFLQFDIVKKYIINDHWLFGIGTGQYRDYLYKNYSIFGPDIHSQYLNVMAENGIFIFILFVLFNCWIIEKIISSNTGRLLKILGVALFIGNFVCSNFNPNQYYYLNNILYYLVMLTIAFYSKKKI
jgi:O-antigen ligase